ncbi:MAG: class I SAM-dependent methyltransferase [Ardenticatenaceae bacterium]|nr:class I SAM-dependent methyltransferase [Anaerolineales bacterium]MCB8917937.1 class I SAM-dependent methyltransferase [Ardenticatenaceae bacterium]
MNTTYERLLERYNEGNVPWDAELPPPEVLALIPTLPPGRALDLGCGYGRASIYMASQGWQVDGVDFIDQAVAVARQRATAAGVDVRFHVASITDLGFLAAPYDFALDVGCSHALDEAELRLYEGELARLLRPGAIFLLYVRLRDEDAPAEEGPRGMPESWLRAIFTADFDFTQVERGLTTMADGSSWASAWYWLRRKANPAPAGSA